MLNFRGRVWGGCRVASGATYTNVYGILISSTYTYIRTMSGFKLPHQLSNKFNVYIYRIKNVQWASTSCQISSTYTIRVLNVYDKGVKRSLKGVSERRVKRG